MEIGELEGAALPDLAGEFTETLCTFWRAERARYTIEGIPKDGLYMLLDSLANVVLGEEE